jgi:predicted GNAT superfamily acetyltransferase
MNSKTEYSKPDLKILETTPELASVEALQSIVWPNDPISIVPIHLLIAAVHHGGLVIGEYSPQDVERQFLQGFVFGFPGFYSTPDGPRLMHVSHMLAVHPEVRSQGLGYSLKRAQWQMVRNQQIDRIIWTFDPLLSLNAHLNINRLGAVCNTYHRNYYGEMRDGLNAGLPSDRFQVDWWVNAPRARRRLQRHPPPSLKFSNYISAGAPVINPTYLNTSGLTAPGPSVLPPDLPKSFPIVMVEIPTDFQAMRTQDIDLAATWRVSTREIFEAYFLAGYFVTDFVYDPLPTNHSYYILTHGQSTL